VEHDLEAVLAPENRAAGISERGGCSQRAIFAGFRRKLGALRAPKWEISPLIQ
jgi:hypothetical protein